MSPTIRVDEDVYSALQDRAEAFVDTPNSVLRRILGLTLTDDHPIGDEAEGRSTSTAVPQTARARSKTSPARAEARKRVRKSRRRRKRAPSSAVLPESEYEIPLLEALEELGGSGPARDVIDAVGQKLNGKLTEVDRAELNTGAVRWTNRVQFVRLKLVKAGDMLSGTERGVWAISERGRARLRDDANEER